MKSARISISATGMCDHQSELILDKLINECNFPIRRDDDVAYGDESFETDIFILEVAGRLTKEDLANSIIKDIQSMNYVDNDYNPVISLTIDFIDEETFTF